MNSGMTIDMQPNALIKPEIEFLEGLATCPVDNLPVTFGDFQLYLRGGLESNRFFEEVIDLYNDTFSDWKSKLFGISAVPLVDQERSLALMDGIAKSRTILVLQNGDDEMVTSLLFDEAQRFLLQDSKGLPVEGALNSIISIAVNGDRTERTKAVQFPKTVITNITLSHSDNFVVSFMESIEGQLPYASAESVNAFLRYVIFAVAQEVNAKKGLFERYLDAIWKPADRPKIERSVNMIIDILVGINSRFPGVYTLDALDILKRMDSEMRNFDEKMEMRLRLKSLIKEFTPRFVL